MHECHKLETSRDSTRKILNFFQLKVLNIMKRISCFFALVSKTSKAKTFLPSETGAKPSAKPWSLTRSVNTKKISNKNCLYSNFFRQRGALGLSWKLKLCLSSKIIFFLLRMLVVLERRLWFLSALNPPLLLLMRSSKLILVIKRARSSCSKLPQKQHFHGMQ